MLYGSKESVMKQSIDGFLYFSILIGVKLYDRVVSEDPFLIVYSPDKQKTQKMCNKAVDCSLAALKFIPD